MNDKPLVRGAPTDSAPSRGRKRPKSCLTLRPFHVLERHDPPVYECDGLLRDWNARRDVSVIERIVEWIAEEYEPVAVMTCSDKGNTGSESIAPAPRSIRSAIGVGSSFVSDVNPCLSWSPTHGPRNFALGRAPCQPHGVFGPARSHLASTYPCLMIGGKALVNFRMLRNAVLGRLATGNE